MKRLSCLILLATLAGCGDKGGSSSDVYADVCARADECNMLYGMSADECADSFRSCNESQLPSDAADWETNMQSCLNESSCDGFLSCYDSVPGC